MQYNFTTIKSEIKDILLKEKGSKFIGFAIIIFLFTISCKTKNISKNKEEVNYIPYYLEVYKADSLKIIGKNKDSFFKLDSLFKIYKPLNQIYIYELSNYIRLSEELKQPIRRENLQFLIEDWGITNEYIIKDSLILKSIISNKIEKKEIEKWELNFKNKLSFDYKNKLDSIRIKDQKTRGKKIENIVDREHYEKIITLINEKGYPTMQKVGFQNNLFLGAFYIHMASLDYEKFENLEKIIFENIKKGIASPYDLEIFVNSYYYNKYDIRYFGEDGSTSGFNFKKINLTNGVYNKRRKKIGLPSLEYSLWKNNILNNN